jgi:hypothetical protein
MLSGVDVEHSQNQAKLRCVILADRGHITVGAEKFCKCLKVSLESLHRRELDLHPIRQKVIPRFSPLRGHERSLAIATTGPVKRCVGSGEGRPFEKLGFKPPPPNALLGHSGRHFRSFLRNPATTPAPSRAQLIS